jgi:hypothetical protein
MARGKKAEADFQPAGDTRRVQRLGPGWRSGDRSRQWLRVFDHNGKSHHLAVEGDFDDLWVLLLEVLDERQAFGERLVAELVEAEVLTVEEAEAVLLPENGDES